MIPLKLIVAILIVAVVFVCITFLLWKKFRANKAIKYIPAVVIAVCAIAFWIKSRYFSQGLEDLAYIIFAFIAGAVFIITVIFAVLLGRNKKRDYALNDLKSHFETVPFLIHIIKQTCHGIYMRNR